MRKKSIQIDAQEIGLLIPPKTSSFVYHNSKTATKLTITLEIFFRNSAKHNIFAEGTAMSTILFFRQTDHNNK